MKKIIANVFCFISILQFAEARKISRFVRQSGGRLIIPDCSKNSQIAASIFGTSGDSISVTPPEIQIIAIPFYILRGLSEIFDVTVCADQEGQNGGGMELKTYILGWKFRLIPELK